MSKKAKFKVWLKSISALAFAMAIVGPVMQAIPAVAGEVIDVDTGPGNQTIWIAQGQVKNPIIEVQIGDVLVFYQASNIPHGLRFDELSEVQRCHQSAPKAVVVEIPVCFEADESNLLQQFQGDTDSIKKPFVVLKVVRRFDGMIKFRCFVHDDDEEMAGRLVMH